MYFTTLFTHCGATTSQEPRRWRLSQGGGKTHGGRWWATQDLRIGGTVAPKQSLQISAEYGGSMQNWSWILKHLQTNARSDSIWLVWEFWLGVEQLTDQFWWVCLASPSASNTKSITRAQVKQQTMKGIRGVGCWKEGEIRLTVCLSVYLSICLYECVFNKKVMIHVCFSAILTASQRKLWNKWTWYCKENCW